MRNTKKKGVFHYRIFKWNGVFYGICLEAGFVEEGGTLEMVMEKLSNGTKTLLIAVAKSKQNLEPSLNTRPPFPYGMYYHIAPLIGLVEFIKRPEEYTGPVTFSRPVNSFGN